jgi:membrane protease YdiL (CAAX protease family)
MATTVDQAGAGGVIGVVRRFGILFLVGLVGIASLLLILIPTIETQPLPPELAAMPRAVVIALSLINPLVMLVAGALLGAMFAHRVNLRSYLAEWAEHGRFPGRALLGDAGPAIALGIVVTLLVLAVEWLIRPFLGAEWVAALEAETRTLATTIMGVLYGGITEEVITRWGLVSLFAWLGALLSRRGAGEVGGGIMWPAIVLAAAIFAALHLPAAAALGPLTLLPVLRILGLNMVVGIVAGWLYWRRSLEAAFLAHMTFHVVASAVTWLLPGVL